MADNNIQKQKIVSENDTLDINELATLNEDISPEVIEQLQSQILNNFQNNDTKQEEKTDVKPEENDNQKDVKTQNKLDTNNSIDNNFIKKYKAKLEKTSNVSSTDTDDVDGITDTIDFTVPDDVTEKREEIAVLSEGNIIEKPISQSQIDYNNNLDLLDDNKNYSKYVIYVEPENVEYIESLTVKERKNLINKILKDQSDIIMTKKKIHSFKLMFVHIVIAIITLAIVIPITYSIINASLEVSIDNYRRSKGLFQVLYQEHGKIKSIK